ncbi:MAG: oligopeptide transporter, OPT family [Deltaproteobacteria bacterium]|nr:oligopeptide transporter, OPT family [Deltaproteobacteria bacterium]
MSDGKEKFVPYVSEESTMREFTVRAVLLGLVMTVILGAANAYLGLKAGMTIAATYPAAVIGMAVLRLFKGSILEENIARTVGSIGESVAAGAIFTVPAFVLVEGLWDPKNMGTTRNYLISSAVMFLGGLLGILFVTVLRRVMVEDATLPFPESAAAAEIHKAGQKGGKGARTLFAFMGVGAGVKLLGDLSLFAAAKEFIVSLGSTKIPLLTSKLQPISAVPVDGATSFSMPAVAPAYLGVGYIIGPRLAALNFAGGVLAWGLFVPLLTYLLGPTLLPTLGTMPDGPGGDPVGWGTLSVSIWKFIIRPIAVGGMLVGAGFTLYRMRNSLATGVRRAVRDISKAASAGGVQSRLDRDISFKWVLPGLLLVVVLMTALYYFFSSSVPGAITAAVVMAVAGFFFAAVSGFLVGTIGSSNNPISGLTLSTLIIAALLMVVIGLKGSPGIAAVLGVAAVVCVSSAVAGEMLQDLKVGHLLGGTPWKMELGDILGVFVAAAVMFWPLVILHQGDINAGGQGFGGTSLPAPQAGLMAMLSKGIIDQTMAWPLVVVGMLMGLGMILLKVASPMLVAVGMYLPLETTFAIFVGGVIRWASDRVSARRGHTEGQAARVANTGVLVAAGLIAGEALMGLITSALSFFNVSLPKVLQNPSWVVGLVVLGLVGWLMVGIPQRHAGSPDEAPPPPAVF